ncbi:hypothetical protein DQK91_18790 [Oceanidesulfovibrio marinus]|uniref:Uncharacterized protein n=2 Tax=Oceanidesulfovibrio marinus TaxID=370038 RepID=A0A6P1ZEV0_9BACT|nr:hypothetical protein DQK91_18790 [Oceanidesulfovibrio marinus]
MVPKRGSYSVGMTVKLRERLGFPYYDPVSETYIPIKPWILLNNGSEWIRAAGGTSPLMGFFFYQEAPDMPLPDVHWDGGFIVTAPLAEEPKLEEDPAFPMPWGIVHGCKFNGLFVYGGNRILAGKQAWWHRDIGNQPVVSEPLNIGQYYHIVMSFDAEASLLRFLISTVEDGEIKYKYSETFCEDVELEPQHADRIRDDSIWEDGNHPTLVGYWGAVLYFGLSGFPWGDGEYYNYTTFQCVQSPNFETVLPRVYHRALSKNEMYYLADEIFQGTYIVDDQELENIRSMGVDVFSFPGERMTE